MDHAYIEEHDIADRYVTGTLEPAEAERFEEHYLSCQICLDRLDLAESMKRGFTRLAEKEAAERAVVSQLALVAWLSRLGRQRQLALLATVVVLLLLPTGFSFYGFAARDRALATARSAHAAEARLRSELQASQRAREDLRRAAQASTPMPHVGPLIVDLDEIRGVASEPVKTVRHPGPGREIALDWVLDRPYSPAYVAILKGSDGKELWRGSVPLSPEHENLTLTVPGAFVPPGDYTLVVQGQGRGGKLTPPRRFTFRILPPA